MESTDQRLQAIFRGVFDLPAGADPAACAQGATATWDSMAHVSLVAAIEAGQISGKQGKDVFAEMLASGNSPAAIIKEKGLAQVSDTGAIEALADQAIAANAKSVADFKAGNAAALNALVGQVMKLSKGKANPKLVSEILTRKLQ